MSRYFITGTDTDVGKTVASAWLVEKLGAHYWKPVQSGCSDGRDLETVMALANCPKERIIKSVYELKAPLSPHEAAELEGLEIDMTRLSLPDVTGPLIVEGAGGILVPLNRKDLMIDLIKKLDLHVIVVARSTLGTINHSLMTLKILKEQGVSLKGVIMMGPLKPNNKKAIEDFSGYPVIAQIPELDPLEYQGLRAIKPDTDL